MREYRRMAIGVQNSVMGFADPFHPHTSTQFLRTGEQRQFLPQDPAPSQADYIALLKDMLGVDFIMHHAIPCDSELYKFIDTMENAGLRYILGNEFYSINGVYASGTARGDLPVNVVRRAQDGDEFQGLLYDETEHRQLHSKQYSALAEGYEWTDPNGKTALRIETDICAEVRDMRKKYGDCPVYCEHVFPLLYHVFARAGMRPCPKLLKEEYQPLQLAVALGAARQYGRRVGICVDLWGFDVGAWFTRLWGFPAHSPSEFESALWLAYHIAPDMMFVENIDALARNTAHGFELTEFGERFRNFIRKSRELPPLSHDHSDIRCTIAVIRSDDAYISADGNFDGGGRYGSRSLQPDERGNSFFQVMNALMHESASDRAITYFKSGWEKWPAAAYPRTDETLARLPLLHGVEVECEETCHPIFHPMNSVLVFDQYVRPEHLEGAGLVIVCGSELAESTVQTVARATERGARAVIPRYFEEAFSSVLRDDGAWTVVENFKSSAFREAIAPWLGKKDEWRMRFGDKTLIIRNPSGDGRTLTFTW